MAGPGDHRDKRPLLAARFFEVASRANGSLHCDFRPSRPGRFTCDAGEVTAGERHAMGRGSSAQKEAVMTHAAFEPIDEEECLELLKGVEYGRLAVVTREGRPEIFPINFAVRGGTVVFITGSEVVKAWAPLGHVAFEADNIDHLTHEGWDVVVTGEGADVTDARDPFGYWHVPMP